MRAAARPTLLLPEELTNPRRCSVSLSSRRLQRAEQHQEVGRGAGWRKFLSAQDQPLLHPQAPKICMRAGKKENTSLISYEDTGGEIAHGRVFVMLKR